MKEIRYSTIAALILFLSLFLAITKPALMQNLGRSENGYSLKVDYGIPTTWFRFDWEKVPQGSPLPKDSVGLDFICIETALRTDGIRTEAYDVRYRGDPFLRPFRLPPLHLLFFSWVLCMDSVRAIGIWCLLALLLVFLNAFFWFEALRRSCRKDSDSLLPIVGLLFAVLFTVSYPSVFEFERGQTDVGVFLFLSLGLYGIIKRRWFLTGAAVTLAALFKVYPIFLFIPMLVAGLVFRKSGGLKLILGQAAAAIAAIGFMPGQHYHYVTKILMPYARADEMPPVSVNYHSLHAAFGGWGFWFWVVVWLVFSYGFVVSFGRYLKEKTNTGPAARAYAVGFYALLAAWMVFLAKTSYDYNLILIIPLFAWLIAGGLADRNLSMKIGGALTLLGYALPRWTQGVLWPNVEPVSLFVLMQIAGILILGIRMLRFIQTHR